jgi:glycosyltransferase involved in cell wall biosynthesis
MVIDDCSTDGTKKRWLIILIHVLDIFKIKLMGDLMFREILAKAFQRSVCSFLDDDDEWLPQKLEKQMAVFRNSAESLAVVYTGFKMIAYDNKRYVLRMPNIEAIF